MSIITIEAFQHNGLVFIDRLYKIELQDGGLEELSRYQMGTIDDWGNCDPADLLAAIDSFQPASYSPIAQTAIGLARRAINSANKLNT